MSSFFQNHTSYGSDGRCIAEVGAKISALKARAVLVDMEEGVVNRVMRSQLGSIFDDMQYVTAVSGCGNNWAHGHMECGPEYRELLLEKVRRQAEACDSLQSFFFLHSIGGGTGSGLGTYLLGQLRDEYPDVYRFSTAIFPSENDDVITSPYNAFFALNELRKHADCVFPMENEALQRLSQRQLEQAQRNQHSSPTRKSHRKGTKTTARAMKAMSQGLPSSSVSAAIKNKGSSMAGSSTNHSADSDSPDMSREEAFAHMNSMAAQLLLDLTSSMRFKGSLNIDLNEITTNLVPFSGGLHFLNASFAPLVALPEVPGKSNAQSLTETLSSRGGVMRQKRLMSLFSELFSARNQLITLDSNRSQHLAVALLARGDISVSEIQQNVERLHAQLPMVSGCFGAQTLVHYLINSAFCRHDPGAMELRRI